jgi:fermentation-respiration switch protein FrsA (DUF1100 family)
MSLQNVHFDSQGLQLAGHLRIPSNPDTKRNAAIVISHPAGGVKEQTVSIYADLLTKLGFITLTFDAAYNGESEGSPHHLEDPYHRVEDIINAVSYVSTLPQVDATRVGVLGVCASGGYAISAAKMDARIRAVATVSAVDTGSLFRDGLQHTLSVEDLKKGLAQASQDRTNEALGKPARLLQAIATAEVAVTLPDRTLAKEGYDYYGTPRGQHPRAPCVIVARSLDKLIGFHAFDQADLISPRPILCIAGSDADTLYYSEEVIEKAAEPKELFLIKGSTHVDLYDKLEYINPAIEKMDAYFTENLDCLM